MSQRSLPSSTAHRCLPPSTLENDRQLIELVKSLAFSPMTLRVVRLSESQIRMWALPSVLSWPVTWPVAIVILSGWIASDLIFIEREIYLFFAVVE